MKIGMGALKSRLAALGTGLAAAVTLTFVMAGSAGAYVNIEPGFESLEVTPSTPQAGGHPNVNIDYIYRNDHEFECLENCLYPRHISFHWPEGFIGNPHVTPKCTLSEFNTQKCPSDAQVGKFTIDFEEFGGQFYTPVYNLQTRPDQAGVLGFFAPLVGIPFLIELSARTNSDYGLDAISSPLLRFPLPHQELDLWGVPQATEHLKERFVSPLEGGGLCIPTQNGCNPGEGFTSPTFAPASTPPAPFLQNPTECGVPLEMRGEIEYHGGAVGGENIPYPSTTGCNQASFSPSITAKSTTTGADSPSGLDTDLKVPQTQSPDTPAPSELKLSRLTLPEGFSINPGAADGKVACPELLSGVGTLGPARCPEFSKIGTLMLDVAALPAPIPGALYLAEPKPAEPYRVLLTASGFATHVKLLGKVEADPVTGQMSVIFPTLPQAPLQEFDLHVFGSERGLLATPTHCGTYEAEGEFVPWNSALTTRFTKNTITVSSGPGGAPCPSGPRPFEPAMRAGVANNTAGDHSPFSLTLSRSDGEQNVTGLTVTTPPGFAAKLKGVPYCPESVLSTLADPAHSGVEEQEAPACPAVSLIGTANSGVGAGSHPLHVPGKVYLAGPYKGAPLSLVVVIPAVSGPYDLGNVAVRAAVAVDPVTARVTTTSDPLPQILDGIPLRTRSVLVNLDRPDFALNPTNCSPLTVDSTATGDEGASARPVAHFQVANCANLSFGPKLTLRLRGAMKRTQNPALRTTLIAESGEANIARATVTLPSSVQIDNAHIQNPCTRVQYAADACPAGSVIGSATAETPLLDGLLQGPVYLRTSAKNTLPDLVVALKGQFEVELVGGIKGTPQGGLRTTFEGVPDVPVSKFVLDLEGGDEGLLINSENLCKSSKKAGVKLLGQNGMSLSRRIVLQRPCGAKRKGKRRHQAWIRAAKKAGH